MRNIKGRNVLAKNRGTDGHPKSYGRLPKNGRNGAVFIRGVKKVSIDSIVVCVRCKEVRLLFDDDGKVR